MPRIFISYRRDDAGYVAGMLSARLEKAFGPHSIFIDVDSIPLGVDFREHLAEEVSKCDVLLAIIGDAWRELSTEGSPRIDDPRDYVRIEIESALDRKIPVIPILVGRATMPSEQELPERMRSLVFRNAAEIRSGKNMNYHIESLVRGLEKSLDGSRTSNTRADSVARTAKLAAALDLRGAASATPKGGRFGWNAVLVLLAAHKMFLASIGLAASLLAVWYVDRFRVSEVQPNAVVEAKPTHPPQSPASLAKPATEVEKPTVEAEAKQSPPTPLREKPAIEAEAKKSPPTPLREKPAVEAELRQLPSAPPRVGVISSPDQKYRVSLYTLGMTQAQHNKVTYSIQDRGFRVDDSRFAGGGYRSFSVSYASGDDEVAKELAELVKRALGIAPKMEPSEDWTKGSFHLWLSQ
jgi:hypothetical protein